MGEQDLVKECLKGNKAAMQELYETYAPGLLRVCRRYAGQRQASEDLLHDSFIKIFRKLGKFEFRGEGSLGKWTRTLTVNNALDWLRHERRMNLNFVEEIPEDSTPPPEEEQVGRIPESELLKMLEELPDGYRTVFNLFVFEKKSHKEIAHMLSIKENSSSSQYARAKKMMAKKIKVWLNNERD